jgi:sulfhydrogenase subunit beta (sulfur reductase)
VDAEVAVVAADVLATREEKQETREDTPPNALIEAQQLQKLIDNLAQDGYTVIGPQVRDGAIVYDPVESVAQLPAGWNDEQAGGHYRIKKGDDPALFAYTVSPQSWKRHLYPAEAQLWTAERKEGTFRILNNEDAGRPPALLGVRACELAAIARQDRILLEDQYRDPIYARRRQGAFIIAVQCTRAAATCFCASMGTGPRVTGDCDLLLTELTGAKGHRFLVQIGSDRGVSALARLESKPAAVEDHREAEAAIEPASHQVRNVDTSQIKDILYRCFEHPRWDAVAARCLSCANCTMVCPTCFCTTVEDFSEVTGQRAERWRRWDSCFTLSFSYIHGGSVRTSAKARYRQWLTHKFASWQDQFGASGCVGCGRCITWCPVGIDVTEELRALREGSSNGNP